MSRCEGFAELVLKLEGNDLAHRSAITFPAYQLAVAKRSPLLMEYGLTQESQFRLHEKVGPHLSSTVSYDAVDKALLGGEGRQLLPQNSAFQVE